MARKRFTINHTRIKRSVTITNAQPDTYSHMSVVVTFEHDRPTGYFKTEDEMVYGLYIDREFIEEFYQKQIKVQLEDLNVVQLIEIYAHPHEGFKFDTNILKPGNKIVLRFKGRDPDVKDISKHRIYWDNATGTYLSKIFGEIDAKDGTINGYKVRKGEIL